MHDVLIDLGGFRVVRLEYGMRLGSRSCVSEVRVRWNRLAGILVQGARPSRGADRPLSPKPRGRGP